MTLRRLAVRIFYLLAIAVLVVLIGGVVMLYMFQTAMLFPASRHVWRTPGAAPYGWAFDDVTLKVGDERTHGWYIPVEGSRGAVLLSHGNGGNIADRLELYAMLRDLNFDVFAYDYGGYGKSSGTPSETRCYADAMAAWEYLTKERGIAPDSIVLYGESLGGGVASHLAAEVKPRAVILQSTFCSVTRRASEIFPALLVKLILKYHFESDKKIGRITAPVLVIHSQQDTIIPFQHGRDLFELAPEPKTFLELRGDHNDCIFTSETEFRAGLRAFLETIK